MLNFSLFRFKVFPKGQLDLYNGWDSPQAVLKSAIESKPSAMMWRGEWKIGNLTELDDHGYYFRFGKTTYGTRHLYDKEGFKDVTTEESPWTHIILDWNIELCGVAANSSLAPNAWNIAKHFARLLNHSTTSTEYGATFEISQINESRAFVQHLTEAYSIQKYWLKVSRPNLYDSNEIFIEPFEKMSVVANGQGAKAEIIGEALDPEQLSDLSSTLAARGDEAGAVFTPAPGESSVRKRLTENPVGLPVNSVKDKIDQIEALRSIRSLYKDVKAGNV